MNITNHTRNSCTITSEHAITSPYAVQYMHYIGRILASSNAYMVAIAHSESHSEHSGSAWAALLAFLARLPRGIHVGSDLCSARHLW